MVSKHRFTEVVKLCKPAEHRLISSAEQSASAHMMATIWYPALEVGKKNVLYTANLAPSPPLRVKQTSTAAETAPALRRTASVASDRNITISHT